MNCKSHFFFGEHGSEYPYISPFIMVFGGSKSIYCAVIHRPEYSFTEENENDPKCRNPHMTKFDRAFGLSRVLHPT